jgi:hypothetical protein
MVDLPPGNEQAGELPDHVLVATEAHACISAGSLTSVNQH